MLSDQILKTLNVYKCDFVQLAHRFERTRLTTVLPPGAIIQLSRLKQRRCFAQLRDISIQPRIEPSTIISMD